MQYTLLTRHAHRNEKLNRVLGVGDLVHSEDPVLVRELLEIRGGSHYSPVGFSNISGQGFAYFSPENFSLAELKAALAAPAAHKVEAPKVEPVVAPEPVVEEKAEEPAVEAAPAAEEPVVKAEGRGRKKAEPEAAQAE